jgi:hypothetical protein
MAKSRPKPGSSAEGEVGRRQRQERLAHALRDNLARRKAQERGRDEAGRTEGDEPVNGPRHPGKNHGAA